MLTYHTEFPPEPQSAIKPAELPLPLGLADHVSPLQCCKHCKGTGWSLSKGFTVDDERGIREYPSKWNQCHHCDGVAWFHAPDLVSIAAAIKGRKPGSLRSKRPDNAREYFVWRLARFHGGKDVTLPMGAEMEIGGDPYKEILDEMAKILASSIFGSGNVGTARWQQAMYGSHGFNDVTRDVGLMPVHDGQKPLEEMLETI